MGKLRGKNKKKAWKKQIDISDVEQRLEDDRLAERVGYVWLLLYLDLSSHVFAFAVPDRHQSQPLLLKRPLPGKQGRKACLDR